MFAESEEHSGLLEEIRRQARRQSRWAARPSALS
jgi:hypothetical protein